ncbi:hypothetical protein GCG54_00003996 [Colletotrichum gloeosporioides]|uniref:Uncharacterized protein n=1 Tax=Colletotrichum gloeosporioides TaxID=474922 RepID=A0A8H4FD48_COLGL|nr:uncharacterized protein GCG54_00003996 [Colletotrichum gloeosporioides]KAF3798092.1 hypothetical protein GCG54_00003996 [Colletotrichum gloeosporioides]
MGGGLHREVSEVQLTGGDAEHTLDSSVPGSQEHATRVIFRHVGIAEAALETLMTLPREMLKRLRIEAPSHGGGDEGFFDVIKSGVQKTGPAVLDIAKTAVQTVILVIVDEFSEKIKCAVGAESSATPYDYGDNHSKMGRFNAVAPKQAFGKTTDHSHKAVEVSENSPLDL